MENTGSSTPHRLDDPGRRVATAQNLRGHRGEDEFGVGLAGDMGAFHLNVSSPLTTPLCANSRSFITNGCHLCTVSSPTEASPYMRHDRVGRDIARVQVEVGVLEGGQWRTVADGSAAEREPSEASPMLQLIYEAPAAGHTLVAHESGEPMRTMFTHLAGRERRPRRYLDVHDYIDMCRKQYDEVGRGSDHVDSLFH